MIWSPNPNTGSPILFFAQFYPFTEIFSENEIFDSRSYFLPRASDFILGSPPLICCDKLDVRSPSGYGDCTGTFRKTSQLGPNGMVMYKQVSDRYSKEGSFLGTNYIYYYETDLCVGPNPSLECGQDQGLTFGRKNDNLI